MPALESFAISSLIITRGPALGEPDRRFCLSVRGTLLPPRADAAFAASESLWYFVEVANPTDPAKVMLEPRLRRQGRASGRPYTPFAAILQPLGPKRFLARRRGCRCPAWDRGTMSCISVSKTEERRTGPEFSGERTSRSFAEDETLPILCISVQRNWSAGALTQT